MEFHPPASSYPSTLKSSSHHSPTLWPIFLNASSFYINPDSSSGKAHRNATLLTHILNLDWGTTAVTQTSLFTDRTISRFLLTGPKVWMCVCGCLFSLCQPFNKLERHVQGGASQRRHKSKEKRKSFAPVGQTAGGDRRMPITLFAKNATMW